ncbi:MAG: hypothetical protein JNL74_09380, partial [Fibrobacteres bacterium]|nr:hypothetical protein [Fibrobacterota bacterium]
FTITSSKTGDTYEREIPWDTAQTARQNLTLISSKLIRLFEENLLARVQLQSEPPEADLLIDNSIKAVTPFETFLPLGRHTFLLTLAGHDTLDTKESVAPGNNRFSFLLKPKTIKPPPERISVVIREKEHSPLPWFIASGVLLTVGVIAEAFYINTDKEYDNLVSNDKSEYDNLDREANRWILVRNVTGITCSITTCYGLYKYLSK